MIENHPQEDVLIRYADGFSTPEENQQVQVLIENDQTAAEFLKQLELTQGWLKEASVVELDDTPPQISHYVQSYETPHMAVQNNTRNNHLALAATLLFGLIGGAFVGTNLQPTALKAQHQPAAGLPEWVRLVADYHRLYDRETISGSQSPKRDTVSAKLSSKLGRAVEVPDLTALEMEFKRQQSLAFDGVPIVQLVYLPENARPVAVCILASEGAAASDLVAGTHANLQYAYWQDDAHAVVIVGEISKQQLSAVTDKVRSTLFSAT